MEQLRGLRAPFAFGRLARQLIYGNGPMTTTMQFLHTLGRSSEPVCQSFHLPTP